MKLALNAGQPLDATSIGVYQALWEEGFEDLPYEVVEAAFKKTLREAKFWPIKVADIRQHVDRTKETATKQAAEEEWHRVLDLRRRYFNPDMPGGFSRGMPVLDERVSRAARASGVFKLQDGDPESLHVWGKKRFIDSYIDWTELEQGQFLLPDGKLKDLLAGAAELIALPPPSRTLPAIAYTPEIAAQRISLESAPGPGDRKRGLHARVHVAIDREPSEGRRENGESEAEYETRILAEKETDPHIVEEIRRQKAAVLAKYGKSVGASA